MNTPRLRMGVAMQRLGVCRNTLKKYINEGYLDAERLPGGHWRISEESIDAMLNNTRNKALAHLASIGL
ncbi:MAG: helix-turn-helix domain-containing protein [Humidesulfovibrio sp.]|uniref:helix-turn-helix domain-containing protein n=1 Tax=Humidesulfovibrio sp. TaxID=2910988 RepID=UPI0027367A5E|nr:helix-turn-helix domain-containing protein [Humidesulfovibrio sp.]MDP2848956.1 helix-turn-helix domain-containing protein [Humidesulfovibrio sp.]